MKQVLNVVLLLPICLLLASCNQQKEPSKAVNVHETRAQETLDSIYALYTGNERPLLRETFPFDAQYTATYLASEEQAKIPNQYAYLWPYSGIFSAANALLHATGDKKYEALLDTAILPGLEAYFDDQRLPAGYASYINTAPASDRFYDDNVWLGIDFVEAYTMTEKPAHLDLSLIHI